MVYLMATAVIVAAVAGLAWRRRRAGAVKALRPDPFTLGEPWRRFVQHSERSLRSMREIVKRTPVGPIHDRLDEIAGRLRNGADQVWLIAKRGDDIDGAVTRLRLGNPELESITRLEQQSAQAKASLSDAVDRTDALIARAEEVSLGTGDAAAYAGEVDELVLELESLRQAIAETGSM